MVNRFHADLSGDDIHPVHAIVFDDAAARSGYQVNGADTGKIALQADDGSFWLATDHRWIELGALTALADLREACNSHKKDVERHQIRYTDAEARDAARAITKKHAGEGSVHHERYTDDDARKAVGLSVISHNEHNQATTLASKITIQAGGPHDVWIQGGDETSDKPARHTALLGHRQKDILYVNFKGHYTGGTVVGGRVMMDALPDKDPNLDGALWRSADGVMHISLGKTAEKTAASELIQSGTSLPATGEAEVVFPASFQANPVVTLTSWTNARVWVSNVSPKNFTWGTEGGGVTVNWLAVGS